MRKEILKLVIILGFIFSMYQVADAQVIVKMKPVKPRKVIIKTKVPGRNFIWISGHWKWKPSLNKYVWVNGRWVKQRKGKIWIPGHWKKFPAGHIWVPGHWRKR